ncbi:hypothetical protein [uncultured Methanobrevibacter sp.]|uniref:hypothetical protein n=1 Tax=uncultured Methanobrevibacter sp. TaxID=253161 RepID=UPI00263921AE|nr:hypothetical protein [uncultured Methanobrevibacter sp.]
MDDVKNLTSIDITSYTTIGTGIGVLFSVLISIVLLIGMGILYPQNIGVLAYFIPAIVVGTIMYSIYNRFAEGYLYNWLTKRMNPITIELKDDKEITKISTVPTALIIAIISTILVILAYALAILFVPLIATSMIQTLMFSGQTVMAFALYQGAMMITQPSVIALVIVGVFIISFVFTLIATYIYNFLGSKGKGIIVDLSKDGEMTLLNSINPVSLIIVLTAISLIFNIILAIISLVSGGNAYTALGNIISGLINGVVGGGLLAVFYNFLAPKLGKLKIELIDN